VIFSPIQRPTTGKSSAAAAQETGTGTSVSSQKLKTANPIQEIGNGGTTTPPSQGANTSSNVNIKA
jgi:hypothetical protein